MINRNPTPGVTRQERISAEGLQRLERQLQSGAAISDQVLAQWIRRYGDEVIHLLRRYGRYPLDTE